MDREISRNHICPACQPMLCRFISLKFNATLKPSTSKAPFYSIKWSQSLADFEDPCDSSTVKTIVKAAKKKLNSTFKK